MDGAWAPAPRGMPHPQSDFAKRINKLAAASPVSTKLRDHLVALARMRGLDLIHNQLPGLDLVALGPNGVRIYDGFVGRDQYVVKGTTSLRGTVSDLLGQLRHQTASTHDCRRSFYQLFLRTFTHSINLKQADDVSTVGSDAIQVHWLALRGDGVHATPFDIVFASHSQQYVWDRVAWRPWTPLDGSQVMREAATHVWESIDTRTLPAFDDATTGCARLKVHHSGFVIEKSPDVANHCVVSFVLCFNDRELSRPWMQELVGGLPRFCGRDHFLVIPTQLWSYNAYCHLCFKTFRLYRRRHHCRLCGHATCSSCSHNVEIDVASDIEASFVRQTPVLTCHRCSVHYRTSRRNLLLTPYKSQGNPRRTRREDGLHPPTTRLETPTFGWTQHPPVAPDPFITRFADDNESTFTIHAPSSLPHRSVSVPTMSHTGRDVDLEALYSSHVPVATTTGLRPRGSMSLPVYTRPSYAHETPMRMSQSSESQSSLIRRRPSTSQGPPDVDAKCASAPSESHLRDEPTTVYYLQLNK